MSAAFEGALREVAFAYEHVPFLRAHLDRAGVRPARMRTVHDFGRVPVTGKADYRRYFPADILADGVSLADPTLYRSQSSGTTGERLVTVTSRHTLTERMAVTLSANPPLESILLALVRPRCARYAAPNCSAVECARPDVHVQDRILDDGTLVLPVCHDLLTTPARLRDQAVAELNWWSPDWLYVDPTHLSFLLRHCSASRLRVPQPRAVVTTYTAVTGVARRQIGRLLGGRAPLVEVIAMSELGWLGIECPRGSMHLNADSFYLELLRANRSPARRGEVGELVVTTVGDCVCPRIRYETGDCYRLLDACPCGHGSPAVSFEGRRRAFVRCPSGRVLSPRQVDEIVGTAPWMDVYKLHQLDERTATFSFIPNEPATERSAADLAIRLRGALPDLEIDVQPAGCIACAPSGKFLSCLSELETSDLSAVAVPVS